VGMRFRDWPLGVKLLVAPGLVMATALAAAMFAYVVFSDLRAATAARTAEMQVSEHRMTTLRLALVKSDLALFRAIIWRGLGTAPEVEASLISAAEAQLAGVATLAEIAAAGVGGSPEAPLVEAVRTETRRYVAAARAALSGSGGARQPPLAEAERRYADADAAVGVWRTFHIDDRQRIESAAEDATRRIATAFVFGACGAFAVGVMLSLLLSRRISASVHNATGALTRLAAGETGVEVVAPDRADEVGRLLQAAVVFKENALALEAAASERAALEARSRAALQEQFDRVAASEQRLRDIAESASDWFWETDAEDRLTMVSGRFFAISGFAREDVVGATRLRFAKSARTQEDAAQWVAYAKDIAAHRPFRNLDYCIQAKDGRVVHIRSNGVPFFDEHGRFGGYRGASSDVTELVDAQREALQSSRLASVGQLAAGIAHEINTPIQYIGDNLRFFETSFGQVGGAIAQVREASAADPALGARVGEILDAADVPYLVEEVPVAVRQSLDGVEHVARIVRSMKEFSHPGSNAKVMTDINRAVESTLIVTTNEWKHTAKVEKHLAEDLPKILCLPADINQVLLNLVVNASHALEGRDAPGLIRVSTRLDDDAVEIRVADNGPGVPEDLRERVFDPFFTTKPVGKGTGQGLAIAMDVVVKKHGGRLSVEETPGGGATFVVRLPVRAEVGGSGDETLDSVRR